MVNVPDIQTLFRQITSNPAAMQNLITTDSIQQMNTMMTQNPALVQQVLFFTY